MSWATFAFLAEVVLGLIAPAPLPPAPYPPDDSMGRVEFYDKGAVDYTIELDEWAAFLCSIERCILS
jgi:hypothetical protein